MPNLTCNCEDFQLSMPQIIAAKTNNYLVKKYTGKPFKFCPWCQRVLTPPEIEGKKMSIIRDCGNCFNWMKKWSCPREEKGGKPTCNDSPCEKYLSKEKE